MSGSPVTPGPPPAEAPPPPHRWTTHLRAGGIFLVVTILVTGVVYPLVVTGIAGVIDPSAAGGSLLYCPNGTVVGSADIAQNLSSGKLGPGLFWARPSLTDYNTTLGASTPPGPSDPALLALLNETIAYLRNGTGNTSPTATLPNWWVAASGSSVDPDLTPAAVLVQVLRVSNATNLSIATVNALVNSHITQPPLPFLGVPFVNVLELDIALLSLEGRC
ncbi:MAG TPA: potassium-transporting ATPase subunit C [Thermoplasmata archaeon]|nr:potassium-transporting ATPase subunit C [Thermoplasmata archaeon]